MDSQRTNGDLTPPARCANIQKMSRMNIFMLLVTKKMYLCIRKPIVFDKPSVEDKHFVICPRSNRENACYETNIKSQSSDRLIGSICLYV